MPIQGTPAERKQQVFDEFGKGQLHSGPGGPLVKSRKQAIAIALSVARRRPKRGRTVLAR